MPITPTNKMAATTMVTTSTKTITITVSREPATTIRITTKVMIVAKVVDRVLKKIPKLSATLP